VDMITATLAADFLGKPAWAWGGFLAIVLALLVFDLTLLHGKDRTIGVRESLVFSSGYIAVGLAFGAWVWWYLGAGSGTEYVTAFLIEKTLAMDNVFVIAMIFGFFAVPQQYQHRVLFWGILGVLVLRAIMIGLGTAIITQFSWMLYFFGAILVVTGVKMLRLTHQPFDIEGNPVLRLLKRHLRVTAHPHGNRFWVKLPAPDVPHGPPSAKPGMPLVWWATPLFLALVLIEVVDLVFAVDSVPAVFAVSQDPFIVYTSNIFAVLGLRALYFALAAMIDRFKYLKYALALLLIFIGGKIIAAHLFGQVPAWLSLSVTFALLGGGILYSLYQTRMEARPV
jgi:tellurite resistance protein TerC